MVTPSRPIAEVLRYNGNFNYLDRLISALSDLANRVSFPTYLDHAESDTQEKVRSIIKDLRTAKANINVPKIGVSKLDQVQIDKIKGLAECLRKQQVRYERFQDDHQVGAAPVESPFGARDISIQWLKELAVAKLDVPSTTIGDIVRKNKKVIEEMLDEIREENGDYKKNIKDEVKDHLCNFDLTKAEFIGIAPFAQFLASAPKGFAKLCESLSDKERETLYKEMKKHKVDRPLTTKEKVRNFFWAPFTALKATLVCAALFSSIPYTNLDIPLFPSLHSWTIYGVLGAVYTAGHYTVVTSMEEGGAVGKVKKWATDKLKPVSDRVKPVWEKAKEYSQYPLETKDVVVSMVKEIPIIGHTLTGSKLAKVALITLVAKYCFSLGVTTVLPDEASLNAAYETLKNTASWTFWGTTVAVPTLLQSGFQLIRPFTSSTTIAAFITANYVYGNEIAAAKAKVKNVAKKAFSFAGSLVPNPKPLFVHPFRAIASLCPSFISSRLGFGKAAKMFTTPLTRGTLPHACQLLDDPKYSPSVQRMAKFVNTAISPVAIFMGACQDLVEKNISHPEKSRVALTRYCQANKWKTESISSFASAVSSGEAVMNWGAKIPGLNVVFGQLRSQIGMITAVGSGAIGLSMMVVGNQVTRQAGEAILREFTVQGAANMLRGLAETYFYLLSLVMTLPWDLSGHRFSIIGETPSPLHVPLAARHIADEMLSKTAVNA